MGNSTKGTQKRMSSKKEHQSIVNQLMAFGYSRQQIVTAMQCVTNPNDINDVLEWLEKRKQNNPYRTQQISSYQQQKQREQQRLKEQREKEEERKRKLQQQQQQQQQRTVEKYNNNATNDDIDEKEARAFLELFGGLLSLVVVEQYGFKVATQENRLWLIKQLANVNCSGMTALRDAVVTGILLQLKLKGVLNQMGVIKHKFVHIVLTDGDDTSSNASLFKVKQLFGLLGEELGDICKTFFVGVGLRNKARQELVSIARLGGDSCELFNCEDVQLDDVFNRIQVQLGIKREIFGVKTQNQMMIGSHDQLFAQISRNKFLVLFTLDKSGSMASGGRWDRVVLAVTAFCAAMSDDDILGCILFNNEPTLLT